MCCECALIHFQNQFIANTHSASKTTQINFNSFFLTFIIRIRVWFILRIVHVSFEIEFFFSVQRIKRHLQKYFGAEAMRREGEKEFFLYNWKDQNDLRNYNNFMCKLMIENSQTRCYSSVRSDVIGSHRSNDRYTILSCQRGTFDFLWNFQEYFSSLWFRQQSEKNNSIQKLKRSIGDRP